MDDILSGLANRVFVMNNVHEDQPAVFQTRWALSYLRGPLTREQIQTLMASRKKDLSSAGTSVSTPSTGPAPLSKLTPTRPTSSSAIKARPVVPPDVPEFFVPRRARPRAQETLLYRPGLLGVARLHYADKKAVIDHWETLALFRQIDDSLPVEVWNASEAFDDSVPELDKTPEAGAGFGFLPGELSRAKNYGDWAKALKNYLYRERTLRVWACPTLKQSSRPMETERDFRLRLTQTSREKRDQGVETLRTQYAPKLEAIQEKIRRANERLEREQAQASRSSWDATIAMGGSVLGALLGRKSVSKADVSHAATAAKAATRAAQQRGGASQAAGTLESLRQEYTELQSEFQEKIAKLDTALRPESLVFEPLPIRPKKTDITVERVVLAWVPYHVNPAGRIEAAY